MMYNNNWEHQNENNKNQKRKKILKVTNTEGNLSKGLRRRASSNPDIKTYEKFWLEPVVDDEDKNTTKVRLQPIKKSSKVPNLSPNIQPEGLDKKITLPRLQQQKILEPLYSEDSFLGKLYGQNNEKANISYAEKDKENSKQLGHTHFYLGGACMLCENNNNATYNINVS